jgi:drug/metabolite transporter (DMT)-like permease
LAVFCTAGGFVGQSYAQQITSPTHTALIFILEPVFGAGIAYVILGERLSDRGVLGAVLILTATLVTEFRPVERMIGLLSSGTQK